MSTADDGGDDSVEQDGWGWLGYLDPPDTDAGQVLLLNFVARLAAR